MDITNDVGDLDRIKVAAKLDEILQRAFVRDELIGLLDDVAGFSYAQGYSDCQDIA